MKTEAINRKIAEPYAEALMALAEEQNAMDEIAADVAVIVNATGQVGELAQMLASPIMPARLKKQVLQRVFPDLHPLMRNFLSLLVDRGRIPFLLDICKQWQMLLRQRRNIALAQVTSAIPLNDTQKEQLRQKLLALTSAQGVELELSVDPSLIGGLAIKIGSQIVDVSVRGQLRRLASRLLANV
jgi:F-type H+-transporting ATPase subunit delta